MSDKSGKLKESDFQKPLLLLKFSSIVADLHKNNYCDVSESSLSKIVYQICSFIETHFGKNAQNSKPLNFTKLPMKLFRNFDVDGSLHVILKEALKFSSDHNWPEFDIISESRYRDAIEFIATLQEVLTKRQMLKYPAVFFYNIKNIDIVSELSKIVTDHNGIIVPEIESASHVVYLEEEEFQYNNNEFRVLLINQTEGNSFVHWYYYPDHYDEWIPIVDNSDPLDLYEKSNIKDDRQWHVSSRFIRDCNIFNEWGNELDYEIEVNETDLDETVTISGSNVKLSMKLKKQKFPNEDTMNDSFIPESISITDKIYSSIPPLSSQLSKPCSTFDVAANNLEFTMPQESIEINKKRQAQSNESTVSDPKKTRTASKNVPVANVKFPDWFDLEKVSNYEIRYIPDIIKALSSREYLILRNQIISIYQQNPSVYLTSTMCRQKLSGDVALIISVFYFLDSFEIINSSVKPECKSNIFLFCNPLCEDLKLSSSSNSISSIWSHETDSELLYNVSNVGSNWIEVSKRMKANSHIFSPEVCMSRFASLVDLQLNSSSDTNSKISIQDTKNEVLTASISKAIESVCIQSIKEEIVDLRIKAFEQKVNLITNIEYILDKERDKIETDSRDGLLQKAIFASSSNTAFD